MNYYSKRIEEVLKEFSVSEKGLCEKQVKDNSLKYGRNIITKSKGKSLFKRIIEALTEPMLVILEVAWCITFGVNLGKFLKSGDGDFYECFGILIAISISVILTIVMEGKSQKAFEKLSSLYDKISVKVMRGGELKYLDQSEIVVGDIVFLQVGDKIIADGRLIESENLTVDESMLTGESLNVKKDASTVLDDKVPLAERINSVYSGTFITGGSGKMLVIGVGDNAEVGKIAVELQAKTPESTPLQEKLDKLSKKITVFGASASVIALFLSVIKLYLIGDVTFDSVQDAFLSAIVMIVASVPEGLPTTVAIALTLNVVKLSKSNALIRKLVAAETVGSVSVICSDKTGTLTENKMTLYGFYTLRGKESVSGINLINCAVNSTSDLIKEGKEYKYVGSPTECALLKELVDKKVDYVGMRARYRVVNRVEFSSDRKYTSTSIMREGKLLNLVKGAPEKIIEACEMGEDIKGKLLAEISKYQSEMKRVIAFAHGEGEGLIKLQFDGFAVITDKIRKDVIKGVNACKNAGISVMMLTGDDAKTAYSIAKELKIVTSLKEVVTANDIDDIGDEELKSKLKGIKVVARSTPFTKLRVVKLLKEMGEVVAVTGDGINDAPAIKRADIGISMGAGSEITKEASDVVLLDNSFSTIVTAITFGRNIYRNFQRFITFQLSVNATAVMIIIGFLLLGYDSPFTALQLLWVNLIMDGPPALTLGLEEGGDDLMDDKPVKRNSGIIGVKTLIKILLNSLYISTVLVLQKKFNIIGCDRGENDTVIFSLFIIFQLFNAFNCRELGKRSVFNGIKGGGLMLTVFAITFVLQIILTQFGGAFFATVPLDMYTWLKIVFMGFTVVLISEIYKLFYRICVKRQKPL